MKTKTKPINQFKASLGDENVIIDDESLLFYATDVYRHGDLPIAVLKPQSAEQVQDIVRIARAQKLAVFPRGGGVSYTDAFTPNTKKSVIIDFAGLNKITKIDTENMFVTTEPGVTWAQLDEALKPLGVRAPFWGPFSGLAATVGGSMSQNTISHGTARYGVSAESAVSFDVVTGTGELLRTGSASHENCDMPFYRYAGPDLTALFTGDAGAFGIKTSITLRLITRNPAASGASFSFETFGQLKEAMAETARLGLVDENFAIDPVLQQGQIARQDTATMLSTAWLVFKNAKTPFHGLASLVKMGLAGKEFLKAGAYSAHFIVDGVDMREVKSRMSKLYEVCQNHGVVVANTVPTVVMSMPFAPLWNILGPKGERWVPLHGVVPFSRTDELHAAWEKLKSDEAKNMETHGVTVGAMFSTISTNAFLYEIAFYWPEERHVFHNTILDDEYLQGLESYEANPKASAYMDELKEKTIKLFSDFGAVHFQLGKAYPFAQNRDKPVAKILSQLKTDLDPDGILNPGALGLNNFK